MWPFICHGRDRVVLSSCTPDQLKVGDIVLFQTPLGNYMLHRITEHNALWHYLAALANAGLGNRLTAVNYARTAYQMEPGNAQYRALYEQLSAPARSYQQQGTRYGYPAQSLCANPFVSCIAANLLCNCLRCGCRC